MKQYAAHRVYLAGTEEWCNGPQVVSVSEGKVLSLFPFSGEIPSVEWLGGLLIVAPCLPERMEAESLTHFLKRIPKSNMDSGTAPVCGMSLSSMYMPWSLPLQAV